ncbi:complement component C8 alpha chain [Rhynchocyon petersi]
MFAVVFLILSLIACQPGETLQEKMNRRVIRADYGPTPTAVNCQLGSWSEWTDCFPCQDQKHRYRSLLQPNKFGGTICSGDVWDKASCQSPTPCLKQAQCGDDFQCKETGRCLKRHLLCNQDWDCLHGSDEDHCEEVRIIDNECSTYDPIPGSERVALGYNILTQTEAQNVYDAKYYGGQCETVYNGEWRELRYDSACERLYYGDDEKYFRKPYNFLKYQFEALADSQASSELYDDANSLHSQYQHDFSLSVDTSIGVGLVSIPLTIDVGLSGSTKSSELEKLSNYKEKKYTFIRIFTKVQTAHFKMRRDNIVLDEEMVASLMELPEQYDYGMYSKFIDDYGTHYITSGSMGGIYEYILVVNKERMESSRLTSNDIMKCFGGSVGIEYEFNTQFGVETKLSAKSYESMKSMAVEDVISLVRGGSGTLTQNSSIITYRSWGRSLKYNPIVTDVEMKPIYELLQHTNLGHLKAKSQNLHRALEQYLIDFNACRCGPCFNNGVPTLQGTSCKCDCPLGRNGIACERMEEEGAKANGRWSCWSSWSTCSGGSRERRRECNNPAPKNGGATCPGKKMQTQAC